MSKAQLIKRIVSPLLVMAVFFILARVLYSNIGFLSTYEWHFRWYMLFPSLLFMSYIVPFSQLLDLWAIAETDKKLETL